MLPGKCVRYGRIFAAADLDWLLLTLCNLCCLQDEVLLEFHVDDTTGDDREDTLIEMAFHVPPGNEAWGAAAQENGDGPVTAAKVSKEGCCAVYDLVSTCDWLLRWGPCCEGVAAWGAGWLT